MANYYDTARMRECANRISQELHTFETNKRALEQVMNQVSSYAWRDSVSKQFLNRYHREAEPISNDIEKTVRNLAELMQACATRFSNVIDDGNAWLSSR